MFTIILYLLVNHHLTEGRLGHYSKIYCYNDGIKAECILKDHKDHEIRCHMEFVKDGYRVAYLKSNSPCARYWGYDE